MGKQKIGEDVLRKKTNVLSMSAKERQQYEEWLEEEKQRKKAEEAEEMEGKEIKAKMPEEPEPSDDVLAREKAKLYEDMARLKSEGKLKVSKVVLKEEEEE